MGRLQSKNSWLNNICRVLTVLVVLVYQPAQDEAEREEFFRLKKVQAKKAKDKAIKKAAALAKGIELDAGDPGGSGMGGMVAQQADEDLLF